MKKNYTFKFFMETAFSGVILLALFLISTSQVQAQNPSTDIDQCQNGRPEQAPTPCDNANYVHGNVNPQNSHYTEGDSLPFRIKFGNLTVGTSYTITLNYGSRKGGKHAYDYLTSYDRTETVAEGNNPCDGVANCNTFTTFPIPVDPNVPPGVQELGNVFTLFGGTITGTSAYTETCGGGGIPDCESFITLTFTASKINPVLAFGAHFASRFDYPVEGSAADIPGSPYHLAIQNFSGGSGDQDRSSKVDPALVSPSGATITIIKDVISNTTDGTDFTFSTTNLNPASFMLDDDNDPTLSDTRVFQNVTGFGTTKTVTESQIPGFTLSDLFCTGGLPGSITTNLGTRTATINAQNGDNIVCTFTNTKLVTTAAAADISGRILASNGHPISRANVTVFNTNTLESRSVITNRYGYFGFQQMAVGDFYLISVNSKGYWFASNNQGIGLTGNLTEIEFVGIPFNNPVLGTSIFNDVVKSKGNQP